MRLELPISILPDRGSAWGIMHLRNQDSQTIAPRRWRHALVLGVSAALASCASQYVEQLAQVSANSRDFHLPTEVGVEACRESLQLPVAADHPGLDSGDIRLINWNMQKNRPEWKDDYRSLTDGKHLVLIQEASLREETINDLDASKHWSFAPGYRTGKQISGVLTLSSIKPTTQCSFVTLEPVFRTPKATSITQYALTTTDDTLVVVNVHAVNFSLGLGAFREQFDQIGAALAGHRGPVILSGDFNTWRAARMEIIDALAASLELTAIEFEDDHRVRVLGKVLDHIYVRGLSAVDSDTRPVTTSDHNPMSATFSM